MELETSVLSSLVKDYQDGGGYLNQLTFEIKDGLHVCTAVCFCRETKLVYYNEGDKKYLGHIAESHFIKLRDFLLISGEITLDTDWGDTPISIWFKI